MIEIKNVSKSYKNGVEALRNVSLTIADGEFCFIVGRSGSGKSTLVRLLTKELEPTEGEITVNGLALQHMKRRLVPKYRRRLGVVFQDFRLLEDRSVYENIGFAELIAGKSTPEIRADVAEMLERVGLSEKHDAYPRELSGGEQQRTAIARALINRPEILIADEPTGNLDHENAVSIMQLLERIHAQGTTVIVITHDLELVRRMNKRTVHMADGEIISDSGTEEAHDGRSEESGPVVSEDADETVDAMESEHRASEEAATAVPEPRRRRSRKRPAEEKSVSEETPSISEIEPEATSKTLSTERPRGLSGSHRPRHVSRRKGGDVG